MDREAEIFEMPAQEESDLALARRMAQGRSAVERYVERLENAVERLDSVPEASELLCALAELREGMIENDPVQAENLYRKALDVFQLSHLANLGIRRLSRSQGNYSDTIESLQRELMTSKPERKRELSLELARTYLYCLNDTDKAIAILENFDTEDTFDPETFMLWEDALIATRSWEKYEKKLRSALAKQNDLGPLTQHFEERLWLLYKYIMPDEEQSAMLCKHLVKVQPLDDELVEDELRRAQKADKKDKTVEILSRAIERLGGSKCEQFYKSLLADISAYEFEDRDHAIDVLTDAGGNNENNLILLHQQFILMADSGYSEALLDVMAKSLELLSTPRQKAEQLHTIACILRDEMDQDEAAMDVFIEANDICPIYEPTIEALAKYFIDQEMWDKLAHLYEYEISYAKEHQVQEYTVEVFVALHTRLAKLYEDNLHYALNAFNHYQAILKYHPDDIMALKGASRMAQITNNWADLLQLYADAEGCTQDTHEHVYLLERIAEIADIHMDEADTACTALEALRTINPDHSNTLSNLARLYLKLGRWDSLISLTDEEIQSAENPDYKATLLCRNAEICEHKLINIQMAIHYYEEARKEAPCCRVAFASLRRIFEQQKNWEKLISLLKSECELTSDVRLKSEYLRQMADVYHIELDDIDHAVETYESCLRINPDDDISRHFLINDYRQNESWENVLRILDIERDHGGTLGAPWLTSFWKGRIQLYRMHDEMGALKSFAEAFSENPDDMILLKTWLSLSHRLGQDDLAVKRLEESLNVVENEKMHDEIVMALADIRLSDSHDPTTITQLLEPYAEPQKLKTRGARFLSTLVIAVEAAKGEWIARIAWSQLPRQAKEVQRHALQMGIILNLPEEIRPRAHEILCQLTDWDYSRQLWVSLSPSVRPDYLKIPQELLDDSSHDAQDLRRWITISMLLAGEVSDPTNKLLPENRNDNLSYRPDLELLAAYFERFENWYSLLEVLNVQEENTLNEQESIQVTLQRAWVLKKINRPEEALISIRKACEKCSYTNPMRLSLYEYLSTNRDWDFLTEQIRQHLMHTAEKPEKSMLWIRMADIYRNGMNNLEEALRCLNNAYQEDPSRGDVLQDISKTALKIGEHDIARRALDDYIRYHHPSLDEQLTLEPQLLELHFKYPGGDTNRIIKYFEELVDATARSKPCLIVLAQAHAIAGDPQVAAGIILDIVSYPFEKEDIDLWLVLADLYLDRLNEQEKGEQLLWELFKTYPEITGIFERLNKLYRGTAERRIMVEDIRKSVQESTAIQSDKALVRKYLGYAASILANELGAWKEAQELYSEALAASEEPAQELVKNRAYARCRIPGEAKSAYREFCDLLVHDPFQADIYRAAFDICRRNNARDRERILRQLATVFLSYERDLSLDNGDLRPKMMDSRLLSDEVLLKYLTHPSLQPVQLMLHEAMPLISDVLRDLVPKRTNLGGERVRNDSITRLFSMCGEAFGFSSIKGFHSHDVSPMPVVLEDPTSYWISMETWETMPDEVKRHWAGYACGMLWTGVSKLAYFDPREVWRLLDGCYYLVTSKGITSQDCYTKEASERVNSAFKRSIRRDIAKLIDEIGPENMPLSKAASWVDGLYATADRAGLLFSGSLMSSIPAIIEAEGWDPTRKDTEYLAARFEKSKRIPELIAFALSDDYLQLRFHAGLSMQPSVISG